MAIELGKLECKAFEKKARILDKSEQVLSCFEVKDFVFNDDKTGKKIVKASVLWVDPETQKNYETVFQLGAAEHQAFNGILEMLFSSKSKDEIKKFSINLLEKNSFKCRMRKLSNTGMSIEKIVPVAKV